MIERGQRHFPDGADPEQQQHEAQRLASIKEYIDYLAFIYSRDEPVQEEDIAQEARLGRPQEIAPRPGLSYFPPKSQS